MLYGANAPARWLRTLVSAIDQAAAGLRCDQWQSRLVPCPQPQRIVRVSRAMGHDR